MSENLKLRTVDELDAWLYRSRERAVWVFKHSLTCPISGAAHDEFRSFAAAGDLDWALIEVQTAREVSSELARRTGVRHESPQALLLRDGEVVWHGSHWRIRVASLRRAAAGAA